MHKLSSLKILFFVFVAFRKDNIAFAATAKNRVRKATEIKAESQNETSNNSELNRRNKTFLLVADPLILQAGFYATPNIVVSARAGTAFGLNVYALNSFGLPSSRKLDRSKMYGIRVDYFFFDDYFYLLDYQTTRQVGITIRVAQQHTVA